MPDAAATVYVIGDAGEDEFVLNEHEQSAPRCRVASGAYFIRDVLEGLDQKVVCLTGAAGNDGKLTMPALARRVATLQAYGANGAERVRVKEYRPPVKVPQDQQRVALELSPPLDGPRLLIAHHAAHAWCPPGDGLSTAGTEFIAQFTEASPPTVWQELGLPDILINLSASLPELNPDARESDDRPFESDLWNQLYQVRHRVGIVLSVSTLRSLGGIVSRRLSWEQAIEDICSEIHLYPRLQLLSRFRHLFLRNGQVGVIHLEHDEQARGPSVLSGHAYFCPHAIAGIHRDAEVEGSTIGRNTLLLAALAGLFLEKSAARAPGRLPESEREALRAERAKVLREAIRRALAAVRKVDDAGYDPRLLVAEKGKELIVASIRHARGPLKSEERPAPPDPDALSVRKIPDYLLAAPLPNAIAPKQRWHMLDDVLLEAPVHRINVAMAIVKLGDEKVLNRCWDATNLEETDRETWEVLTRVEYLNPKDRAPDFVTLEDGDRPATPQWPGGKSPTTHSLIGDIHEPFELSVPVTKVNYLTLIERDEVESIRGIGNLIRRHRTRVRDNKSADPIRPLCLAVFGPPGSGKSFAVKQIRETLDKDELPKLELNVAQFKSPQDLSAAFQQVAYLADNKEPDGTEKKRKVHTNRLTPLIFFDEFDCVWEGKKLGWLKYFLGPMQDGTFMDLKLGPCIFVFAGGLHPSFQTFDPSTDVAFENLRHLDEYRQRYESFVMQKGPDFISRLRGHINVLSINDSAGRVKHFIRRAVQLRSLLKQEKLVKDGVARMSDAIIYALLTADRYRHGVRSMQAIIEMCSPIHGFVEIASLPSRAQLDMHVDAEEFLVRVHRGRARAQTEWQPSPTTEYDRALRTLKNTWERVDHSRAPGDLQTIVEQWQKKLEPSKGGSPSPSPGGHNGPEPPSPE